MTAKKVRVEFKVSAPQAQKVLLAGSFNKWSDRTDLMKKDKAGAWIKIKMLPQGTHEYKYIIDDVWTTDPDGARTVPNRYGTDNSIIEV